MATIKAAPASSSVLQAPFRRVVFTGGAQDLARRAADGDRDAFSTLMSAHKDDLYRFVRRRTSDAEEAYDIVQETFVSAWGAIGRFDPERPFVAWLRSIALNKCRDRARRVYVRRAIFGAQPAQAPEARDEGASPEDVLIARDELARLARTVERLPQHFREALMLTTVDGLSQAAAAAALKCSVKAVEYRVSRARDIIASELGLDG